MGRNTSLFGILILVLDIIAIIDIWKSHMDTTKKVLWILAVVFFPLLGLILWYLIGKKGKI